MGKSTLPLEQQKRTIERLSRVLSENDVTQSAQTLQTPAGDAFSRCSSADAMLQVALSCPNDQVVTLDVIAQAPSMHGLDRQSASALCQKINQAYPFQQMMLVIDHSHVLCETQVVQSAPDEGFLNCVLDLESIAKATAQIIPHLCNVAETLTETQLNGLFTLVKMSFESERRG